MAASRKKKTTPAPKGRYLRRFTLQNVRTFRSEVTLDFCDPNGKVAQWTVILGENGTGKTTLLQYLAGMRPYYEEDRLSKTGRIGWVWPSLGDFKWVAWHLVNLPGEPRSESKIRAKLEVSVAAEVLGEAAPPPPHQDLIDLHVEWESGSEGLKWRAIGSGLSNTRNFSEEVRIFAYGASRHVASAASPYVSSETFFQNGGNDPTSTLYHDDYPLISPEQWFLGLDHASNLEGQAGKAARLAFESAKRCLMSALPGLQNLAVKPLKTGKAQPVMTLMCNTFFGEVPFSALSVGYRTMAAWLTDFIKRMHEAYPEMDEPDDGPAVVLIDEFDLHMHPKWQREAMAALSKEFPNTQFIVTAHSPLVVQATEGDARIIVLRRKQRDDGTEEVEVINDPHYAAGWRVDQILASDLYDLPPRSPKYDDLMKDRIELRQKEKRTKADEKHLAKIEKQLDEEAPPESAPGTDKLFAKLERALDRAEAKEKK